MPKLPNLLVVLLFFALAVNLLYLDLFLLLKSKNTATAPAEIAFSEWVKTDEGCGLSCRTFVEEKISEAIATISATAQNTEKQKDIKTSATPKSSTSSIKVTTYIPLGPGSSTQKSDWTRVDGSEFTFDLSEYPDGKVYWEGNLKAQYTNSRCYARLFDKTNSRAVDYSEQSTDQTTNQYLTSQELAIWFGKLKYQLEIKSLNGITCYLDSPRLVVKY